MLLRVRSLYLRLVKLRMLDLLVLIQAAFRPIIIQHHIRDDYSNRERHFAKTASYP